MENETTNSNTINDQSTAPRVFWGGGRHELIAGAADQLLSSKARQKVADILSPINKTSLESVATWLDDIRNGHTANEDAETTAFIDQYPQSRYWHFVDMPLGASGYDPDKYKPFVNDYDIVQSLSKAIAVFSTPDQAGQAKLTTPVNSLRVIAHLTGDLHQPLHVACGYIEENPAGTFHILSDPEEIVTKGLTKNSDQGGNAILLPLPKQAKLHSYWDSAVATDPAMIQLEQTENAQPAEAGNDPTAWPALWAGDGILKAKEAYKNMTITGSTGSKPKLSFTVDWEGKAAYNKRCSPIVLEQMRLATLRLALLVNTLFG